MKSKANLALTLATAIILLPPSASADPVKKIGDKKQIQAILESIPYRDKSMPYKSLADRLPNLGLVVTSIRSQRLDAEEASGSDGEYRPGDIVFDFFTNEPNAAVTAICPIQSNFQFIKRGIKWIPTSRTSNFLVTWKCAVPR